MAHLHPHLIFTGLSGAGKSTTITRLLDTPLLLPALEGQQCTGTVIELEHSGIFKKQFSFSVKNWTQSEFNILCQQAHEAGKTPWLARVLSIKNWNASHAGPITCDMLDPEDNQFLQTPNVWHVTFLDSLEQVQQFLRHYGSYPPDRGPSTEKSLAPLVCRIRIDGDFARLPKNITLVDCPCLSLWNYRQLMTMMVGRFIWVAPAGDFVTADFPQEGITVMTRAGEFTRRWDLIDGVFDAWEQNKSAHGELFLIENEPAGCLKKYYLMNELDRLREELWGKSAEEGEVSVPFEKLAIKN